jgi:hypothetical protein
MSHRDMSAKGVLFSMPPQEQWMKYANAVNSTDLVWSGPVRGKEAGGSNPLAPTTLKKLVQQLTA